MSTLAFLIFSGGMVKRSSEITATRRRTSAARILGFREGATENAEVCKALIEELFDLGLCRDEPTFFVFDGSKALRKAVVDVWAALRSFSDARFAGSATRTRRLGDDSK